jgi:hypothetical protein
VISPRLRADGNPGPHHARRLSVEIAAERCCTPCTMARIITELVIANSAFLAQLLDDADLPSRSDDQPFDDHDDEGESAPLRPLGSAVAPIPMTQVELGGSVSQPLLEGRWLH